MTELWRLDARSIARSVANRETSAREVVESHLARIASINPVLNAIVTVMAEEALTAADGADRAIARGAPLGPLHGVPFTAKNNIDVAGTPTTWGVPALAQAIPEADAPVVKRLKVAGAILIGRTNLPDMALRVDTDSSLHGRTVNPWNPDRTPGGSSGGEAVALATGMSAIGLGNDIGGSLRSPASACGISALKPTTHRVPDAGLVPGPDRLLVSQWMNVQGPMARTVADVRLAFESLAGADPRDPWSLAVPFRRCDSERAIRVALMRDPPGGSTDPSVSAAVDAAGTALSNAGYQVEIACPPRYEEAVDLAGTLLMTDFGSHFEQLLPIMGPRGRAFLDGYREATIVPADTEGFSHLFEMRDGIARAWSAFMERYDLILGPVWTELPFEVGFDIANATGVLATRELIRPVMPANLLGLPSACVPAGYDQATGLPIGVQITGRRLFDEMCLDAAEVIERATSLVVPMTPRGS